MGHEVGFTTIDNVAMGKVLIKNAELNHNLAKKKGKATGVEYEDFDPATVDISACQDPTSRYLETWYYVGAPDRDQVMSGLVRLLFMWRA